jgi:phasin
VGVADDIKSNLEIPIEVRQLAEKTVGEAKKAFDNFIAAAQKATSSMESQAAAVQSGSMEMHGKIRSFAERNVATCFEFAQKFIQAKNVQEVMQLQAELVKAQMQAITEQTKELADATVKSVMDAAKPKS